MIETAMVLAGGGERAVAWELGVLAGLEDSGFDPSAAGMIVGTSAGAYVATLTAAGATPVAPAARTNGSPAEGTEAFARALAVWMEAADLGPTEQRRRVGAIALSAQTGPERAFLAATAARLPTHDWPSALIIAAVDAVSGSRDAFRACDRIPLAAALAASRAIPGLRPPVSIGDTRYIDGAVGSATNADLADGAARVVVITPTPAQPPADTVFALWDAALDAEIEQLRRNGSEVIAIRANGADLEAMGPDLMSRACAAEAFEAGRLRGRTASVTARTSPAPRRGWRPIARSRR
jgi:NTE family protein